jgi:hypothetical protein
MTTRVKLIVVAIGVLVVVMLDVYLVNLAFGYFSHRECSDCAIQMLLVWSIGWILPNGLLSILIAQLLKHGHVLHSQAVCFFGITFNLVLIFSVCPMDVLEQLKGIRNKPPAIASESAEAKFLIEENKKATDEIRTKDEEEDTWFHNKFILVGGLLAATLGYIGFGNQPTESAEQRLTTLSKSSSTAVILALASVMALGVDMHVRGNASVTDQLGLWIRYYVEPVLLHGPHAEKPTPLPENFYGWEEFLRTNVSREKTVAWGEATKEGSGLHSGELWNLFYEPHIHFLTGFVYVLYLAVFQTFACRSSAEKRIAGEQVMPLICFAVVHASFFAFAWIAHAAPEMFELKVLPFVGALEAGYIVPIHYFVPCLALIILNWPYITKYRGRVASPPS